MLFRTIDDDDPKTLTGKGHGRIGLLEPQTLYYLTECLKGCPSYPHVVFNLTVLGHESLAG